MKTLTGVGHKPRKARYKLVNPARLQCQQTWNRIKQSGQDKINFRKSKNNGIIE